ncbi:charged multivesicular body protein 6 [Prorops nasuta]|uniref:charged multivesicular body protein 6 n=1 Tax=Prorops nasuta TaxID=863751 RepID=UPI0034CF3DEA
MGILFSKKKSCSRITEHDKAVLQLKQTRDKIKQYQKKLEISLEKERLLARKLVKDGKKERALLLLRKKRFQEQLLVKTDGQLENLERMTHDIEFAQVEIKVVDGLKVGNTALKKLQALLSIDDIEKVMDETREGIEKQQEIDEILSGELTAEDESEVEAEFNTLYEAEVGESLPEVPENEELPEVPEDILDEETKTRKEIPKEETREPVALTA